MQKSRIFIITLMVMILAVTTFKGLAITAEVTGINKSKGRININGGINDGYVPGIAVCFPLSSAAYGNELVCGSVVSATASKATVKIPKSRAKKIKMGTAAMLPVKKEAKEDLIDNDMVAQVSEVNKTEGRIHIDGGTDSGFILGATVCFSVSQGTELICGTVEDAEASNAVVEITQSKAEKITIGTEAILQVEEKTKDETKEKKDWLR